MRTKNELTRKEEILKVASRLFKERGYSAVTMRDLAFEMGIKAASLYNHITSKQQILAEIIMRIAQDFVQGIEAIIATQGSAETQLKKVIAQHVDLTVRHPDGLAALNNDWMHLEGQLDDYLKMRSDYEHNFRIIIKRGIAQNELQIPNEEVMLFSFLSTLRNLHLWISKKNFQDTDALIFALSEILLKGVVVCK